MKKSWIFFLLAIFVSALGAGPAAWGDTQPADTHFSLVKGKVKVVSGGGISRRVAAGDKAYPGETIQVGASAQAQVVLFDGSTLDLSSNCKLTLAALKQPSATEKIISLKLALGRVFAQVRKLMTAKSSFEIEAGGVVCGVRGTAFSMDYNPDTKSLDLDVTEGKVSATSGGNTLFFTAGQSGRFLNGQLNGTGANSGNPNGKNGSKGGTTGGTSNGNGGNNSSSGNSGGSNTGGNNGTSTGNAGGNNPSSGGTSGSNTGGTNIAGNLGGTPGGANPGSSGGDTGTGNFQPNACLTDLNTQFTSGILINGDNSLSTAQQSINIHLIVPPGETVP